jgi:hypothetical protein
MRLGHEEDIPPTTDLLLTPTVEGAHYPIVVMTRREQIPAYELRPVQLPWPRVTIRASILLPQPDLGLGYSNEKRASGEIFNGEAE